MKLVSMTEFVIGLNNTTDTSDEYAVNAFLKCARYAKFLSQALTLGMFVPVGDNGNIIEEPRQYKHWLSVMESNVNHRYDNSLATKPSCSKYHKAKNRVLFEGFEVDVYNTCVWIEKGNDHIKFKKGYPVDSLKFRTIEDLIPMGVVITKSAIKQITP